MDGDRIGGFAPSSMTPGKRALFALSLILNEAQESWPLLIDQPEDDLDSRSIYDTVVPYLIRRKRERQIIMVSHNANTVIGADSEQVIVANRHGDDRKNRNGRTFDYLTGSLEHSAPESDSSHVLESCGIREHACKILDGGEVAFARRGSIYKL
jgi:ABC-type cobalamin/Fe3+-siderophores transport system ATPase subunit